MKEDNFAEELKNMLINMMLIPYISNLIFYVFPNIK